MDVPDGISASQAYRVAGTMTSGTDTWEVTCYAYARDGGWYPRISAVDPA